MRIRVRSAIMDFFCCFNRQLPDVKQRYIYIIYIHIKAILITDTPTCGYKREQENKQIHCPDFGTFNGHSFPVLIMDHWTKKWICTNVLLANMLQICKNGGLILRLR